MSFDFDEFRILLRVRKRAIAQEIAQGEEAARPVELDPSRVGRLSRMDAMQNQAMSAAAQRRRQIQAVRVETALGRISAGTFGQCANCGDPIAEKRLKHDPSVPVCIECAQG